MKNTIDDADYIIDWIVLIIVNQYVTNSGHSHSIINEPQKSQNWGGFFDGQ